MQSIDHELKIEKVAEAPNGAMRLLLSDGSEWVVGIKSWNRLNLSLEKILRLSSAASDVYKRQYHLLRTKALELLGIREHSRQELKRKLIARFHNHEPEIERCLEELQSEDYLSDQRFTQLFIESRLNNKRVGPFKIVADLQQRGIDRDTAHSIMDELADEEFWLSKIKDNLEELCNGNKQNNRQALGQKLFQRGFAYELINQALNDLNFSRY